MIPNRRRPPTSQEAVTRVQDLVRRATDPEWIRASLKEAEQLSWGDVVQRHHGLQRLHEINAGWLNREDGVRLVDWLPDFAPDTDEDQIAECFGLLVFDAGPGGEVAEEVGPYSDFEPLNAVPFASVAGIDYWFCLVVIPGDPPERWPVLACEPAGQLNIEPVAIDLDHFWHEWFCRDGPYFFSPIETDDLQEVDGIAQIASACFDVDRAEVLAAYHSDRAGKSIDSYIKTEDLATLMELCELPSE